MKSLAVYPLNVAYRTLSADTTHIWVPLETNASTQSFAQGFSDLLDKIRDTSTKEDALALDVARAEGFIVAVDADVDVLVTNILARAVAAFGKSSKLYLFLLDGRTEAEIRAPVLDDELDQVKTWVGPLKSCSDTVLQGYGATLEQKIAEAVQRIDDLEKAEQALDQFRKLGGRKDLVDGANALRASVYGSLNQLLNTPAGAGLPADFADRVFEYERARRRRKAPTSKELEKMIADNEKEHAWLLTQLEETRAAEEAAAAKKAKQRAKTIEDALAAAQKKAAEVQAEIAALQAKLPTPPSAPSTPSTP